MKSSKAFLITFCVAIVGVVLNGWVMSKLWSWFIVSTFKVSSLGVAPAIGIAILLSYPIVRLTSDDAWEREKKKMEQLAAGWNKDKHEWDDVILGSFLTIMKPLTSLGVGWIVHLFM